MDRELMRLLLDPAATDMSGAGGGASTADDQVADDSAEGLADQILDQLTPEERAATPEFDEGSADAAEGGDVDADADPSAAATQPKAAKNQKPSLLQQAAAANGLDLSSFADDQAAMNYLAQQARLAQNNDFYANLGRQLAPHQQQISTWLEQQRAAQQQPAQRPAWQAPEFNQDWMLHVERDENTGIWKARPGANPQIADKVNEYVGWREAFERNPNAVIAEAAKHYARETVQEEIRATLAQRDQQTKLQQIVDANQEWLYAHSEDGSIRYDRSGQPVPSQLGARYLSVWQDLRNSGVSDVTKLDHLTQQILRGEIASAQAAKGKQQTRANKPQAVAAQRRVNRNPLQAVEPSRRGSVPHATDHEEDFTSLTDMMRNAFAEEGITDSEIAASMGG